MRKLLPGFLLLVAGASAAVQAADGPNHFVFPVTTDLQRALVGKDATVYVMVNGDNVLNGNLVDAAALNLSAIRRDLEPYRDREKGFVFFRVRNTQGLDPVDESMEVLTNCLTTFGRRAGFDKSNSGVTYTHSSWHAMIDSVNRHAAGFMPGDEPTSADELVRVWAVRTLLSWYLTDNADCVVEIVPRFDEESDSLLDPDLRQSIRDHVAKLGLERKSRIVFRVTSQGEGGRKAFDRMIGRDSESEKLADELGFKTSSVTHTPY